MLAPNPPTEKVSIFMADLLFILEIGKWFFWPAGTHRLLRVTSGFEIPCKLLDDCSTIQTVADYFVFGDFVVCPLEKDTPCAMRSVSIKSARNLKRIKGK
jgi:hypothetical protein